MNNYCVLSNIASVSYCYSSCEVNILGTRIEASVSLSRTGVWQEQCERLVHELTLLSYVWLMRTSLLWIQPRLFVGVGVWLIFGLLESTYLQQFSRLHMDSNLGLLLLHGKIIKSTLRWIQPHVDTLSESVTITDFIQRCILSTVSLFLYAFIHDSENRLLPNNVMTIRNYEGDKEGLK
jgi:hypothetical protein